MNVIVFLEGHLETVRLLVESDKIGKENWLLTHKLIEWAISLANPDVELNDRQCDIVNKWIETSCDLALNRVYGHPQIHIRAMQLATYINSCYRAK